MKLKIENNQGMCRLLTAEIGLTHTTVQALRFERSIGCLVVPAQAGQVRLVGHLRKSGHITQVASRAGKYVDSTLRPGMDMRESSTTTGVLLGNSIYAIGGGPGRTQRGVFGLWLTPPVSADAIVDVRAVEDHDERKALLRGSKVAVLTPDQRWMREEAALPRHFPLTPAWIMYHDEGLLQRIGVRPS